MLRITWHGHACFSITRENGYTIVIDPHDGGSIGLPRPSVLADLILVTHDHFDHNAVNVVSKENSRVIKSFYGETRVDDIIVKGYRTFHDKVGGRRRGENAVYIIEVNGLKIGHLGDLGHMPGNDVLKELTHIDILFIPVGGVYTIGPDEAWKLINSTEPKITIPMHYWVKGLTLPLHTIDDFLAYVKKFKVERLDKNYIDLTPEYVAGIEKTILIFKPPTR